MFLWKKAKVIEHELHCMKKCCPNARKLDERAGYKHAAWNKSHEASEQVMKYCMEKYYNTFAIGKYCKK